MLRPPVFRSFARHARAGSRQILAVVTALGLCPQPAVAQDSRADVIARAQAEKAGRLAPHDPSKAERVVTTIKEHFLDRPGGFYPYFGSVYSGGGFTLGLGFRPPLGDNTWLDVKGLYSIRSYKLVEIGATSPTLAGGRLGVAVRAGWRDATQVNFYGLGMGTSTRDRTGFRLKQAYAGGSLTARPVPWVVLDGAVAFEDYATEAGTGRAPSIEERFTAATAPGLGSSPRFVHSAITAGIDWRTSPGYSRTGGYYGVGLHDYADVDDTYSFRRLEADLVQHIPLLRETWVVSLRGRVETTLDDDDRVPYFLLPSLGSGSTLRGYASWRYRDRHALLASAEWRWIPNRLGMDMALFFDAGKVASRRADLDLDGLKSDVGIGVRFHGPSFTPLRIEAARGREGWRLVFAGSPAF
jgi:hypothetical protein